MTETKKTPGTAQLAITLFVITAIVALLLGLVNYITEDRIAELRAEKTAEAMGEVMPGSSKYDPMDIEPTGPITGISEADDGYVVQVESSGFGGDISMVVGVNFDGTVSGVSIVNHAETSGLGANATREDFREQYVGASGTVAVDKDGGDIDALTGATVTSRAVTDGVNAAIEAVENLG